MRIGLFTPYLDQLTGGEKYMLTMASCLSKQNQVCIFWDPKNQDYIKKNAKSKLNIDLTNVIFEKNIFSPSVTSVERFISSSKFDAIIFLSDGSLPLVNTRLFVHFQFPVEWVNASDFITRFKVKRIEKIICNSEFTKKYIDNKFKVNSLVLYPPVNNPTKINSKKVNIILNVGRFGKSLEGEYFKKQDVLIATFKKMIDSGLDDWNLVLVLSVRDEDKDKFKSLQELGKGYPIEFIVNPENTKLIETYKKAKIYWHASGFSEDLKKHPEKAEHFGISTVEAMSYGVVPVVIKAGGQIEIVEDNKNGFLWENPEELFSKTNLLITNNSLWEKMSSDTIKKSNIFTGNRFCQQLNEIIK